MRLAADPPVDTEALREAHAMLTRILDAIDEYVYTGEFLPDGGYRVLFAGPCREQFLGMSAEQARTAVWRDHVHPDDLALFDGVHDDAHMSGRLDVEYRMLGADGHTRWVRDRGRIRVEGDRRFLDGSILDVSEMRATQEALHAARAEADRLAHVDFLTGAANRRSLPRTFEAARGRPLALLAVDIDRFKPINDRLGHAAGDAVLVTVAERLLAAVRSGDAVVRVGGEEFLVVLPDVTSLTAATGIAEALRSAIESSPIHAGGGPLDVTVSIGVALSEAGIADRETALLAADRALYAAKRDGRNRVEA